jgi:delta-aminolevulinic acid dehydratase/porphobilinogen synthase
MGLSKEEPLAGLPLNSRHTLSSLLTQFDKDLAAGVRQFLLFPVPAQKSNRNFAPTSSGGSATDA